MVKIFVMISESVFFLPLFIMFFVCSLQRLRYQLDMKRPIIEQSLEAGRFYLREEGEDKRLSTDSGESSELGEYPQWRE
jgi:hypothetical protein